MKFHACLLIALVTAFLIPAGAEACSYAPTSDAVIVSPSNDTIVPPNARLVVTVAGILCDGSSGYFELESDATGESIEVLWTNQDLRDVRLLPVPATRVVWEGTPSAPLAAGNYTFRVNDDGCVSVAPPADVHFEVVEGADASVPEVPVFDEEAVASCRYLEDGGPCPQGRYPRWEQELFVSWSDVDAAFYEVTIDDELEHFVSEPSFTLQRAVETTTSRIEVRAVNHAGERSEPVSVMIRKSCEESSGCSATSRGTTPPFAILLALFLVTRRRG